MLSPVNADLHTFRSPRFASVVREATEFLTKTPSHPFPPDGRFPGVGVYVLYYLGEVKHYSHIAARNKKECTYPIYVGKAVPPGWRTARLFTDKSRALYGRLREHARSIEQVAKRAERDGWQSYLKAADFRCRFVIFHGLEADLIAAVEAQAIRLWTPIWNTHIDGFGNHDPGSGRYSQASSEWDVLHPGRPWVERLTGTAVLRENIQKKIEKHKELLSSS